MTRARHHGAPDDEPETSGAASFYIMVLGAVIGMLVILSLAGWPGSG